MEFQNLKPGDKVILVSRSFGNTKYLLKKVDRVTKTQIVIDNIKYRRSDGYQITDDWHRDNLKMPTKDTLDKVAEYNQAVLKWHAVKDLSESDWNKFSLEQLKQIRDFINQMEVE